MSRMGENELLTSRLSKVIGWQTYTQRQTEPKLYTTPLRGWSVMIINNYVAQLYTVPVVAGIHESLGQWSGDVAIAVCLCRQCYPAFLCFCSSVPVQPGTSLSLLTAVRFWNKQELLSDLLYFILFYLFIKSKRAKRSLTLQYGYIRKHCSEVA